MRDLSLQNSTLNQRYEIRELLGRGSYAEIYLANDLHASEYSPHPTVVIKALNVFMQNDLDSELERTLVENFQNEAVALDTVRHPNIISRLGHGTDRDRRGTVFHYMVLEYMPGGDLYRLSRREKLSFSVCLDYLEQICAGIAHAHAKGVIHRDIKLQNLLLSKDKKILKIADFGVARISLSDSPITRVGTNVYAPPEHSPLLAGETQSLSFSELTPGADIYSIAKSAYVLFTSESPRAFVNKPIIELPDKVRSEFWSRDLLRILHRATQKDPRNRYLDIGSFWGDLAKLRLLDAKEYAPSRDQSENHVAPKPHYSRGYSSKAPIKAAFDATGDLNPESIPASTPKTLPQIQYEKSPKPDNQFRSEKPMPLTKSDSGKPTRKTNVARKSIYRAASGLFLLMVLVGSLFATYNYLRGGGFSFFGISADYKMGTATTDINLRSSPTTSESPIGLVTKNSRLRVVNKQNNWYQIEITSHGRPKTKSGFADSGWAYGEYIDLDE